MKESKVFELIDEVCDITVKAGNVIMKYYNESVDVEFKDDRSPLTIADRAAHDTIVKAIEVLTPDIPVLSEESSRQEIQHRKDWEMFWLVDPLDGTKEFIKKTGEFTVNIALINKGKSLMGVVYVPAQGILYYASPEKGSFKKNLNSGSIHSIKSRKAKPNELVVVASRDHAGPEIIKMIERLPGNVKRISMGSSLKFCLIAEGVADIYLRDQPTMEWDTAAAQAIIEIAGGKLTDLKNQTLAYNKLSLRNPLLLAWGDTEFDVHKYVF